MTNSRRQIVTMFAGDHAIIRTTARMLYLIGNELDSICDGSHTEDNRSRLHLAMAKIAEAKVILDRMDAEAVVSQVCPGSPV